MSRQKKYPRIGIDGYGNQLLRVKNNTIMINRRTKAIMKNQLMLIQIPPRISYEYYELLENKLSKKIPT